MILNRALFTFTVLLTLAAASPHAKADIAYEDLRSIQHSAVVQSVAFKQVTTFTGPRIISNPTAIELELGIFGGCKELGVDSSDGRIRFVQVGSMAASTMSGCIHKVLYYWDPGSIFDININDTIEMSVEVGPAKRYEASGAVVEEWFKVTAKVTRRFGTLPAGKGNYFEYSDVRIEAPAKP